MRKDKPMKFIVEIDRDRPGFAKERVPQVREALLFIASQRFGEGAVKVKTVNASAVQKLAGEWS
jgi:hypothetical protein